jgi:hypothetical protein
MQKHRPLSKLYILLAIMILTMSCSQSIAPLPYEEILDKCKVVSKNDDITIDDQKRTIQLDKRINSLILDYQFNQTTIFGKDTFDILVALNKKDNSNFEILFPQYKNLDNNKFLNLFYGKSLLDQDQFHLAISNLFLKINSKAKNNCTTPLLIQGQSIKKDSLVTIVNTSWRHICNGNFKEKKIDSTFVVKYISKGKKLTSIQY